MMMRNTVRFAGAILAVGLAAAGCATLQQIAALRQVDFAIDHVANTRLAGVSLDRIRDPQALGALDVARIAAALAAGRMPLAIEVHLSGLNPAENNVAARLVQLDWTLLLDERETITGVLDREFVFQPGVPTDVPIEIQLDLADFFAHNAQDMIDLALAVAGAGGEPKRIALLATPTIQTALGPIRYPQPIRIVSRTVGG
jgi:hypothetical protein